MTAPRSFLLALALALVALPCAACGGSSTAPAASPAQDATTLQARLAAGPWVVTQFQPDAPAGRMFGPVLAQQIGQLTVTFDGQTVHAKSATLAVDRPYSVQNVTGFVFDFVSSDAQGAEMRSHCEISADGRRIRFVSQTDPFAGTGVIERQGP